jgi:hypothetical protein
MTEGARDCPRCGAPVAKRSARFCDHCGAELAPAPTAASAAALPDTPERFDALRAHAHARELLAATPPSPAGRWRELGCVVFSLAAFVVVGLGMMLVASALFPPFVAIVAAILVFGLIAVGAEAWRRMRAVAAPLERLEACVIDERVAIVGGDGATRTRYFVTLSFPDRTRRELEAVAPVAGAVTRGDMGIAFLRGETLIDFRRVPV